MVNDSAASKEERETIPSNEDHDIFLETRNPHPSHFSVDNYIKDDIPIDSGAQVALASPAFIN